MTPMHPLCQKASQVWRLAWPLLASLSLPLNLQRYIQDLRRPRLPPQVLAILHPDTYCWQVSHEYLKDMPIDCL